LSLNLSDIKGKRIAGIDFGLKRIGLALSDELHIISSPKEVFQNNGELTINEISNYLKAHNVGLIVIGIPGLAQDKQSEIITQIRNFKVALSLLSNIQSVEFEEDYSSKKAVDAMIQSGMKKKKRQTKGSTDIVSAAIILKEFLDENK